MNIQILRFKTLQSTNDMAAFLAQNSAKEGTIVIAEKQSAGRGRNERFWCSPQGGLWFSLILRPKIDPKYIPQVTLLAGVVVAKVLRKLYETDSIMIKWPNDLLVCGKKICGILSEMRLDENGNIDYVVLGIGINVKINKNFFPQCLKDIADSLNENFRKDYTCDQVLDHVLSEFDKLYEIWLLRGSKVILDLWKIFNCTLNQKVDVKDNDKVIFSGTVIDINEDGSILVDDGSGNTEVYNFGEISLR